MFGEKKNQLEKENRAKQRKGVIYIINLIFLILSIPILGYISLCFFSLLLLAEYFLYPYILTVVGEIMIIIGFRASRERERKMKETQGKVEADGNIKKDKIIEIVYTIFGVILIAISCILFSIIEIELW